MLLLFILYAVPIFLQIVHRNVLSMNNRIIVAFDNTYTMESKDEFVFIDFFFHPIPLVVYN